MTLAHIKGLGKLDFVGYRSPHFLNVVVPFDPFADPRAQAPSERLGLGIETPMKSSYLCNEVRFLSVVELRMASGEPLKLLQVRCRRAPKSPIVGA